MLRTPAPLIGALDFFWRPMTLLSEAEMGATRTPDDLARWASETCTILEQSKESRAYARSGERLPKNFWEEIRPFSIFASSRFGARTDVKCTPNLGSHNCDGVIEFDNGLESPIYIEATYAKDGHDESERSDLRSAELVRRRGPL